MMCRRIHELLSGYIDGELSESESLKVQAHLDRCACCCDELESLRQTKLLLGELARQRPRAELERLLVIEARRAEMRPSSPWDSFRRFGDTPIRPRVALATAALSLTALWAATTRLAPGDEEARPSGTVVIGTVPVFDQLGNRVSTLVVVSRQATPPPAIRLPEPPRSEFLSPDPPGLLSTTIASWSMEPRYQERHFTVDYPRPSMDDPSLLCNAH